MKERARTLVIKSGAGQDYSEFYDSLQKDGFYLIVNLAEGGKLIGHEDKVAYEVLVDDQPQYVRVKSAKVYSF